MNPRQASVVSGSIVAAFFSADVCLLDRGFLGCLSSINIQLKVLNCSDIPRFKRRKRRRTDFDDENWLHPQLDFSPMSTQYSRLISDFRLLIFPAHQQIQASLNRTSTVSTGVLSLEPAFIA